MVTSISDQKTQIKRDAPVAASVCYVHVIDLYMVLYTNQNEEEDVINSTKKDGPTLMTNMYRHDHYLNTIVNWCGM